MKGKVQVLTTEVSETAIERILKLMSINLIGMSAVGVFLDIQEKVPVKGVNIGMGIGGLAFTIGYIWYKKRK